jgi:hypothetical protein
LSDKETLTFVTYSVSSGTVVTVPSLEFSGSFKRKIAKLIVKPFVKINGSVTYLFTESFYETSDDWSKSVTSRQFTATTDTEFIIGIDIDWELKTASLGFTTSFDINCVPNGKITAKLPTGMSVKQVKIGPNGFCYIDGNGGEMSIITVGGDTQVKIQVTTDDSKINGFYIDKDEFIIYAQEGTGSSATQRRLKFNRFNENNGTGYGSILWQSLQ